MDHAYFSKNKKHTSRNLCSAPQCNNRTVKGGPISLHQFPPNQLLRKKWRIALRIGKDISSGMRICSEHFTRNDYILPEVPTKRKCLKKTAVPSQNLPISLHKTASSKKSSDRTNLRNQTKRRRRKREEMTGHKSKSVSQDQLDSQSCKNMCTLTRGVEVAVSKNIPLISDTKHCATWDSKWIQPEGTQLDVNVYNSVTKTKTPLIVGTKSFVTWYMCGPTVYDSSHIGHARCYIQFDIIRRILENVYGLNIVLALGITNIDEKIINAAQSQRVPCEYISKKYELEFARNMIELNVKLPTFTARVTDYIPQIVAFIQDIIEHGAAYVGSDGSVYFDTSTYAHYGKFCPPAEEEPKTKTDSVKKSSLDFVLWRAAKPNEPQWESPWSPGRPGWHIECSAMASHLFGSSIDIHTGGIDLKFPHHENEDAQSCSFHNKTQWVNYWMHSGHLLLKEEKMSKSLQNTISIDELLQKYSANQFRLLCLLSNYRKEMQYTDQAMVKATAIYDKINSFLGNCDSYLRGKHERCNVDEAILLQELRNCETSVKIHLSNDFDTASCISAIEKLIGAVNVMLDSSPVAVSTHRCPASIAAVYNYVSNILEIFGLQLLQKSKNADTSTIIEHVIDQTVQFRSNIRTAVLTKHADDKVLKQNILDSCDVLRNSLEAVGVTILDKNKTKSVWRFKENI